MAAKASMKHDQSTLTWAISGGNVVQGTANLLPGNNYRVNLLTGKAIVELNDFNTTRFEGITFTGPGSFAVLNRVIAGGITQFDG